MNLQFTLYAVAHMIEVNPDPFPSCKLKCWNHIAIAGHDDHNVYGSFQRKPRYVEPMRKSTPFCSMLGTKS